MGLIAFIVEIIPAVSRLDLAPRQYKYIFCNLIHLLTVLLPLSTSVQRHTHYI